MYLYKLFSFCIIIYAGVNYYYSIKINNCLWRAYKNLTSNSRVTEGLCKERINILINLHLSYFLCFGSELGAVRERNIIKNDKDIDICIPVWMNSHIFKCNKKKSINKKASINVYVDDTFLLCNKTRNYYYNELENYIRRMVKNVTIRRANILLSIWYNEMYLDFYIMMSNEYIYREINICRCMFCNMYVNCLESSIKNVKNYYGKNFLTPSGSVGKSRINYNAINNSLGGITDYKLYYIK